MFGESFVFSEIVSNWGPMLDAGRGLCKEPGMYPVYQFRVSDGRICRILPVPGIDSRHAELRARGWCAGTAWHVIGRIDSNRPKSVQPAKTAPANARLRINRGFSR